MQDKMKMFGPGSMLLPIRVAYDTFIGGGAHTEKELVWCQSLLRSAIGRGYNFLAMFYPV